MKNSRNPSPSLDAWHCLAETLGTRVSCPRQTTHLKDCMDRQFMKVQAMRSGLPPGSRYQSSSVENLLRDLEQDLSGLFESMNLRFAHSCFGQSTSRRFNERDYLGLWCLVMEFATMATAGSTIETSIGSLSHGLELEIGSDCPSLEQAGILKSAAFEFASSLMPVSRAMNLKCPLGGGAIQLDIPGESPDQRRQVA